MKKASLVWLVAILGSLVLVGCGLKSGEESDEIVLEDADSGEPCDEADAGLVEEDPGAGDTYINNVYVGPNIEADIDVEAAQPEPEPEPEPYCGDGTCDEGEDHETCPADCDEPEPYCGDGTCDEGEDSENCSEDCGEPEPVNAAPVAADFSVATDEDTAVEVVFAYHVTDDPGVGPLVLTIVEGPAHGELTVNEDGSHTYTPEADWNGIDLVTYKVSDGELESGNAVATIVVNPVADYIAGPFRSTAPNKYEFNVSYVSDATCGELRGALPVAGLNWLAGPDLTDLGNGWIGVTLPAVPAGTYEFSYLGWQDCDANTPADAWAQYGAQYQLLAMSPEDRAYVVCDWWDGEKVIEAPDGSPSCGLKAAVDANGVITAAGNMGTFGEDDATE